MMCDKCAKLTTMFSYQVFNQILNTDAYTLNTDAYTLNIDAYSLNMSPINLTRSIKNT